MLVNSSSPEINCSDNPVAKRKHGKDKSGKNKSVAIDLSQLSSVKFEMTACNMTDTALLVSSELTADACQFATSLNGKLIAFPAIDGKVVMNAAVLGSVALFEIVRQLQLQAMHTSSAATETSVLS